MIRRHTTHNMIKFETLLSKKIECKMSNSSFCWKLFEKKNSKWTSSSNTTTIVIIIAFYMLQAKLNTNSDLCALSLFNTTFYRFTYKCSLLTSFTEEKKMKWVRAVKWRVLEKRRWKRTCIIPKMTIMYQMNRSYDSHRVFVANRGKARQSSPGIHLVLFFIEAMIVTFLSGFSFGFLASLPIVLKMTRRGDYYWYTFLRPCHTMSL